VAHVLRAGAPTQGEVMRRWWWWLACALLVLSSGLRLEVRAVEWEDDEDDLESSVQGGRGRGRPGSGLQAADPIENVKQLSFALEHSLDHAANFSRIGHFSARSTFHPTTKQSRLSHLRVNREAFTAEDKKAFQHLIDTDGYYRIRVPTKPKETERFLVASLKARCLADAGLQEHFELHQDAQGNLVALSYSTPSYDCSHTADMDGVSIVSWKFGSTAAVSLPRMAPRLNPQGPGPDAPPGTEGPEAKDRKPKTFLQKYWIVILPAALMLLQGLAAPDPQAAAGGGGGGTRR